MRKITCTEKLINGLENFGNATIYVKNISDQKTLSKSYRFTTKENGAIKVEEILEFFDEPFFNIHGLNKRAKMKRRHILKESTNIQKYIPQIIFSELNGNLVLVNTDLQKKHNNLTNFFKELMLKLDLSDEELSTIINLYRSKKYDNIIKLLEEKKTSTTDISDAETIKDTIREKATYLNKYKRDNLYKAKSETNTGKFFEYLQNYGNAVLFLSSKNDLNSKMVKATEFEVVGNKILVNVRTFIFDRKLFNEEGIDLDARIIGRKKNPDQLHHVLTKKDLIKIIASDYLNDGFIRAFRKPFDSDDLVFKNLFNDIYSLINFTPNDIRRVIKHPNTFIKILKEKAKEASSSDDFKPGDASLLIDNMIKTIKDKTLMPDGEQLVMDIKGDKHEKK